MRIDVLYLPTLFSVASLASGPSAGNKPRKVWLKSTGIWLHDYNKMQQRVTVCITPAMYWMAFLSQFTMSMA